jgi:hypothetical protein
MDGQDLRLAKIEADVAEIKDLLKTMYPLLISANARSEEQTQRISDLSRLVTTLVPTRLAAVGER